MRPVLFQIGDFKVHSYGVLLVVGLLIAIAFGRKRAARYGFTGSDLSDVAVWALIPGVLGARLFFVAQEWGYYKDHVGEIFAKFEGLTSFGGLIFGFLGVVLWSRATKKPLVPMLDLAGPCFLIAHAVGRVGCLLNGCCYGGSCSLPWGVTVHDLDGRYHPAQIYDSLMNLGALWLVLLLEKRGLKPGQCLGLSIALHGVARFIYEFWRAGTTSTYMGALPITDAQAMALAITAAGLVAYYLGGRRPAEPVPTA